MEYLPYTYLLHHIPTNQFYYGVRWKIDCNPDEFWKTYFTSSKKIIPELRKQYGDDSFEFEIRKTFETVKSARKWESKVLRRMRVLKNKEIWMNRTNNKAILKSEIQNKEHSLKMRGISNPFYGKNHSKETMNLIQKKRINTIRKRGSLSGDKNPMYGKQISIEHKKLISTTVKNLIWITNGIDSKRIPRESNIDIGWRRGRTINWLNI